MSLKSEILEHKHTILSTAILPEGAVNRLQEEGFELVQHSFIQTQSIFSTENKSFLSAFASQKKNVLFTSANAVNSVIEQLENTKPNWHFYCISGKTKDAVSAYWGTEKILGYGNDALEILETMTSEIPQEIIFFCGNKRLDTLPDTLTDRGFDVKELIVYQTELSSTKLENSFDAIIFFSPSGIESFLQQNTIPMEAILFAIGNTTAKHLGNICANQIIVSPSPDKNILVKTVIEFYKNKEIKC